MKTVSPALQSHLNSGATTMAYCWKLTRKDGAILGFTEHDEDLLIGGVNYSSSTGLTASNISSTIGLGVDTLAVNGVLRDAGLTSDDILSGRYDDAELILLWVNWEDTSQFVILSRGYIGSIKESPQGFVAEFTSLSGKLDQMTGRLFQRYCDAELGDSRCKVDLLSPSYTINAAVVTVTDNRVFTISSMENSGFFNNGKITFIGGQNDGLSSEIKTNNTEQIILWNAMQYPVLIGDTVTLSAGCQHTAKDCKNKFNNIVNYQGFLFIPGNDQIQSYPVTGKGVYDGGSLFQS